MLTKHSFRILLFALALSAANAFGLTVNAAQSASNSEPPVLAEQGSFFVGGEIISTDYPRADEENEPGHYIANQMYVQYQIPQEQQQGALPVIMVHGSGHTGKTYETTPDGREGWATYFVRQGFPVYVVDQVGRARSSFDPTSINQAVVEANAAVLPSGGQRQFTNEDAWTSFRFGPEVDVPYPNTQFPVEVVEQYYAQLVPNTESTVPDYIEANEDALAALIDQVGPAIVMVHSQSGRYIPGLAVKRPDAIKALINVEGSNGCIFTPEQLNATANIPYLSVAGDFGWSGDEDCTVAVEAINAAGGNAFHASLPEQGFEGNSHMLMMDRNNLEVADWILTWIDENVDASAADFQAPAGGSTSGGGN